MAFGCFHRCAAWGPAVTMSMMISLVTELIPATFAKHVLHMHPRLGTARQDARSAPITLSSSRRIGSLSSSTCDTQLPAPSFSPRRKWSIPTETGETSILVDATIQKAPQAPLQSAQLHPLCTPAPPNSPGELLKLFLLQLRPCPMTSVAF